MSFTKGKSINTLVELLHKNDEAAAAVKKDLKDDKDK
jgi:pseudouridine-5'-phosphate glycosidase